MILKSGEKGFYTRKPTLSPRNEFNLIFVVSDNDKKIKKIPMVKSTHEQFINNKK